MAWLSFGARQGFGGTFLSIAATAAAALVITSDIAHARHHGHARYVHVERVRHHDDVYAPPASSILVDGNSGAVLEALNPDALRHPASLTKVMTLYLLFERLEAGRINLDTPMTVSEHASEQSPTKLDLKPGQTISVEDAIKGIVTRSANDAAVVIAENLGGDEASFARLMTQKARALGMSRTTYVNASGLPDDDQVTTARDQALLGRAIQERFPRYYRYFSTTSFVFHGVTIRGHNHLLGEVDGVDGIKTGFTRASGFNLLTSLHRDGRYVVGVVMGGPSASERDAHMRELISDHFKEAALRRTAPMLAQVPAPYQPAQRVALAKSLMNSAPVAASAPAAAHAEPAAAASTNSRTAVAANDPIRPLSVRTISYRTAPVPAGALAPMPALVPVTRPQLNPQRTVVASADPAAAMQDVRPQAQSPAHTQAQSPADSPAPIRADFASLVADQDEPASTETAQSAAAPASAPSALPLMPPSAFAPAGPVARPAAVASAAPLTAPSAPSAPVHARGGWLIQIGAYDDESEAKQHLSAAQSTLHAALATADPFTERVQKGDKAFYRARFAGFDKATAEATCKQLKRSDFACMALKDGS